MKRKKERMKERKMGRDIWKKKERVKRKSRKKER